MVQIPDTGLNTSPTVLDELHAPEARSVFDTVDTLSSLGVGGIIDLPRIIVVGQQSAGKSSVLQAVSGVQFPTHDGVCTRFATELVIRTGKVRHVKASIRYHDKSKPDHQVQVQGISHGRVDLIIAQAKEDMGITDPRDFSKNVLRLDIEDPNMFPLMIVDLPGMYETATEEQSREGIEVVRDLVRSYMQQSNSIMLAIVTASEQLANQRILEEQIYRYDPRKERTIGVITKPDLLQVNSSTRDAYMKLLRGKSSVHKLKLGWHVVRNRSDRDERPDPGQEDTLEADFFRTDDWPSISPLSRGVPALRKRLSQVLYGHIKQTLPQVIDDIGTQLAEREEEFSQLGRPRSNPQEMRAYLVDIASRFQKLVDDGVEGHYRDAFFGHINESHRKLRARLREFNRMIRQVLRAHGSTYLVDSAEQITMTGRRVADEYGRRCIEDTYGTLPMPEAMTRDELSSRLREQAAANQGMELPGFPRMTLVTQLFEEQSRSWKSIAERHVRSVTDVVQDFVQEVIRDIIGPSDMSTTSAILTTYVRPFFDAQEEVLTAKLQEILVPFQKGYGLPLDDEFQEALERLRAGRGLEDGDSDSLEGPERVHQLESSDEEFGIGSVIDATQIWYQMALRSFTENLINLVIESCLVRQIGNIFTPRVVNDLDDTGLEELAAEMKEVSEHRSQLATDIAMLKAALKKCRHHRPGPQHHEAETMAVPAASSASATASTPSKNTAADPASSNILSVSSATVSTSSQTPSSRTDKTGARTTKSASNNSKFPDARVLIAETATSRFYTAANSTTGNKLPWGHSGTGTGSPGSSFFGGGAQPAFGSSSSMFASHNKHPASGATNSGPSFFSNPSASSSVNPPPGSSGSLFGKSQGGPSGTGSGGAAGAQQTGEGGFSSDSSSSGSGLDEQCPISAFDWGEPGLATHQEGGKTIELPLSHISGYKTFERWSPEEIRLSDQSFIAQTVDAGHVTS